MPKVTFQQTGTVIELENNSPLIDIEDQKNNELPFGCRNAACGTCAIDVIYGMENLTPKNEEEIDLLNILDIDGEKRRLACQCILHGDITIDPMN